MREAALAWREQVAFDFRTASCVAVGSFNVYIIQPAWLVEVGILAGDLEKVGLEINLAEPGFRILCSDDEMTWSVQPSRITIKSNRAGTDCGRLLGLVLKNLPHTPVRAIGSNARYEAPLEEVSSRFFDAIPDVPARLGSNGKIVEETRHWGIAEGDQVFNLSLIRKPDSLQLSVNVHTDLNGRRTPFPQEIAEGFVSHLRRAETIVTSLFDLSIHDEPPNNDS